MMEERGGRGRKEREGEEGEGKWEWEGEREGRRTGEGVERMRENEGGIDR